MANKTIDEEEIEDFASEGSIYPDEFVNPKTKERAEYGLKYAKAMFGSSNKLDGLGTWTTQEYDELMELATGRQSVEGMRKLFGFFKEKNESADNDGSSSLAYIDIKVLNLAPKYINRAVAKITSNKYDMQLAVIDPVSIADKRMYEANIQAYYEMRAWMDEMGQDPREMFPDLDISALPEHPDELMYEMITNPKLKKAVDGELSLQLIHEINDFNQVRRLVAKDIVTIGRGHIHSYRDENGIPREERVNPKYYIGSFVETEDYKNQENCGFFDFLTVSQFRKEARASLTDEEIEDVIIRYSKENANQLGVYTPQADPNNFDGLSYIPVMRFYFLSQDNRVYITRNNKSGNETLMERSLKWKPSEETDYNRIINNEYTSVYGGTWVLDTDTVYNYGRKEYPRSNLVDAKLPIVSYSPNYFEGRTVSFLSQMIEPMYMINVAWNKIKTILAKEWMGTQEIDFAQLENINMGRGGKPWSAREVYKHFLRTGMLIKRSSLNKHDQQKFSSAIETNNSGLTLTDYMNMFNTGLSMLEQMSSTGISESANIPDRLGMRVAQMSQQSANMDMEYLYTADEFLYKNTSHQMLLMVQQAKRDGYGIEGFISALGQSFSVPDHVAYCDYGLFLTRAPGPEEWAEFFEELREGLANGQITHLDSAYIREVRNLKKARQILAQRVKINERKAAEQAQANNQMAIQANSEATANAHQVAMIEMERQREIDLEIEQLKLKGQALMQGQKLEVDKMIQDGANAAKLEGERRKAISSAITTQIKSNAEKNVAFLKMEEQRQVRLQREQEKKEKEKQAKAKAKKK